MTRENEEAMKRLRVYLGQRGLLRILTNEPSGRLGVVGPRAFKSRVVTRLEGPDKDGCMIAFSQEGDWCKGEPTALLTRLLEATMDNPPPDGPGVFHAKVTRATARH